jgi:hypothetical protein
MTVQVASLQRDQAAFTAAPPADPAVGDNLFTFLAARLSGSFGNLGCASFGMADPVTLTLDANGVATGASFGTGTPTPTAPSSAPPTSAAPSSTASMAPSSAASGTPTPTPTDAGSTATPTPTPTG